MNEVRHCLPGIGSHSPLLNQNFTFWLRYFTWAIMAKWECCNTFIFCRSQILCYARYCFCEGTECIPVRFSFPCAINSSLEYMYIWMHICGRQVFFLPCCQLLGNDTRIQTCRSPYGNRYQLEVKAYPLHLLRHLISSGRVGASSSSSIPHFGLPNKCFKILMTFRRGTNEVCTQYEQVAGVVSLAAGSSTAEL